MPRNPKPVSVHDPALVAVFGRSRKSYERNRDELVAKLDAAAQRTRTAAAVAKADAGVIEQRPLANAGASPVEATHVRAPKAQASLKVASAKKAGISA